MNSFAWRVALLSVCSLVYGGLAVAGALTEFAHAPVLAVAFQLAVLLPACLFALRNARSAPSARGLDLSDRTVRLSAFAFLAVAAALSWNVSRGMLVTDEDAYRFEARALWQGRLFAPAPPGAVSAPLESPIPVTFGHAIYRDNRWYFHFSPGWPLALSLPEKLGIAWLVNPILGLALLFLLPAISRELVEDDRVGRIAVVVAVLSPYFLSNVVGRMSHGFSAVLVACAVLQLSRGVRTEKLWHFAAMYALLILEMHVRILTGAVAAAVLGISALVMVRHHRRLAGRVLGLSIVAGAVAIGSVALYNYAVTGHAALSPYALSQQGMTANVMFLEPSAILHQILGEYRGTAQATMLYAFPFVFLLAAFGFAQLRRATPLANVLLAIFVVLVLVHVIEALSSVAGERYWFEGYPGIVVLAAFGVTRLWDAWRPSPARAVPVLAWLVAIQIGMTFATAVRMARISSPQRKVAEVAQRYASCDCAVFVLSAGPNFSAQMILNNPDWPKRRVFYANDPGPDGRAEWARVLHKSEWVVIQYDSDSRRAAVVAASPGANQKQSRLER